MRVSNIPTGNYGQNVGFKGSMCAIVRDRLEQFCSPDEMNMYRESYMKDFYDRPMTKEELKLCDKYEKISAMNSVTISSLSGCMERVFPEPVFLTVRKVKETKNKESVLSLCNSASGKIMDVSPHFDTKCGDIRPLVERFIKRAQSYVAEMNRI